MKNYIVFFSLVFGVIFCFSQQQSMFAKAFGKDKVKVEINYYAEDTCVFIREVKEGHPDVIEAPKRSLVVTVTIDKKPNIECMQKLKVLQEKIVIADRPGVRSVEIFFISKDGKFIRSSKPRIYRGIEVDSDQNEPEISG
jgi:hypothetical protein